MQKKKKKKERKKETLLIICCCELFILVHSHLLLIINAFPIANLQIKLHVAIKLVDVHIVDDALAMVCKTEEELDISRVIPMRKMTG